MEQNTSEIIVFFGRFHPLILHLPIGFLVIAFALETLSRFERFKLYKPAVGIILMLGAASAVIAAILGYMLAQAGGYNEDLLLIHQWSGIGLAVAAVAALILHWLLQKRPSPILDKAYLSIMFLMMISLTIAGHFGGSLTHGSDYLTRYMPNGLRSIAGLPPRVSNEAVKITDLEEALVFDQIIYPIFDTRCVSCHNEDKRKGELMMHTQEALLKGGENGPVVVAGKSAESNLIKRIHLPLINEDHMPPKGKTQLTDDQVKLITWWIDEGAPFDKKVSEVTVHEEIQAVLNTLLDPDANKSEVEIFLASEVPPADKEKLMMLEQPGVNVMRLSASSQWLQVSMTPKVPADSLVQGLVSVAEQLTWLDLGNTTLTDAAMSTIGKLKNLTRLHLQETMVTDEGLQQLKNLQYLEYLNLHGTKVTDEGILQLAGLKNLRRLYLWQTNVTDTGVAALKKKLTHLQVITGMDINPDSLESAVVAESDKEKSTRKKNATSG